MKSICVFCGSSRGEKEIYCETARKLGKKLAARSFRLIYGGGGVGIMGALAEGALESGVEVIGVIPERISRKVPDVPGVETVVTDDMHSRKRKMYELSDYFLALPGGIGTFEEIFEVLTWNQLGYFNKPAAFLNINDYYSPLKAMLDEMRSEGFLKEWHRKQILFGDEPEILLDELVSFEPEYKDKW